MCTYFIDYENVGPSGFDGIELLSKKDKIILFWFSKIGFPTKYDKLLKATQAQVVKIEQKIHRKNYKSKIANTGSYNILGTTTSPNRLVIYNGLYTKKRAKGSTSQLCKYIPCVNWASGKELGFYVSVRAIYINNTNCTTVDEYKAWLDSLEDLMFYYQLADEYVYEEDIIMPKITLFNGDCTFDVITEIKPSKAEVEYWR